MNSDWIKIENKFDSRCIECHEMISKGDMCKWMYGLGIKHIECPTGIEPEESQLIIIDEEDKEMLGMK